MIALLVEGREPDGEVADSNVAHVDSDSPEGLLGG
jgi:hypothetical protein